MQSKLYAQVWIKACKYVSIWRSQSLEKFRCKNKVEYILLYLLVVGFQS